MVKHKFDFSQKKRPCQVFFSILIPPLTSQLPIRGSGCVSMAFAWAIAKMTACRFGEVEVRVAQRSDRIRQFVVSKNSVEYGYALALGRVNYKHSMYR
jgi:hypothetical protein